MPKKITLLLMVLAFVFSSCQSAKNDSFAIYLLTKNIPAAELVGVDINQWEIEKEPILSISDIVSFLPYFVCDSFTMTPFNLYHESRFHIIC